MKSFPVQRITAAAIALAALAGPALAHVSLADPLAQAGSPTDAVVRVGHGCEASPTTAVLLRLPPGIDDVRATAPPGWGVQVKPSAVTWTALSKEAALPSAQKGEFPLHFTAPRKPGLVWLKALQTCAQGSVEWADVPPQGKSTAGMKTPALLLDVLAPAAYAQARMLPRVENAWVRSAVAGQSGTGAFMRLTASEALELVSVSTPVAGTAAVHEMKMEGDVMRMRPIDKLALPAGQGVELKPGGYHVMLQDLKQPLLNDTRVPLTLVFRNAQGVQAQMELQLPVSTLAPGSAASTAAAAADAHKH